MTRCGSLLLAAAMAAMFATPAPAQSVSGQTTSGWNSLVADRSASRVGDSLTVLIYQDAQASNSAQTGGRKVTKLAGQATAGVSTTQQAQGSLSGSYDGSGQVSRSDRMVAAISVVVIEVLPNGDLRLAGEQALRVNGERTLIRVSGRARPSDIADGNTVLSTRLAEANIEYDGSGFAARSARPGLISRVLVGLGLF